MYSRSPSPETGDRQQRPLKERRETDSGYSSGASTDDNGTPEIFFTKAHLQFLNRQLQLLEPQDILRWSITTLPNLYQTTAFGQTGLVTLDMLSKLNIPRPQMVDVIFLDTLHHFNETHALIKRIRQKYPLINVHTYKPDGVENAQQFNDKYGEKLWEKDEQHYDWVAKVEPAERAYKEMHVSAVLTGRRRSQKGKRGTIDIVEIDDRGLIKVNPLANWTFEQVQHYLKANDVPYNELIDRGYKSIGDWHSTQPVKEDEDERAGRWKGQEKTECGIHNPRSKFAQFLKAQEEAKQRAALEKALHNVAIEGQ
ncbi:MAG: hypothetical protein Q9227_003746 [Pyrenula ochraceoflavens]